MKRTFIGLCLLAALLAGAAPGRGAPPPVAVEVYLIDPCGGCPGGTGADCRDCKLENEVLGRYRALLEDELAAGAANLSVYNMRKLPERYDERTERLAALGIDRKDGPLPSAFVGGRLFPGDGSQDEAILEAVRAGPAPGAPGGGDPGHSPGGAPANGPEDPAFADILYLYSPYCRDCRQIAPFIEDIAGDRLRKCDISTPEGLEAERAVHERLAIPEADRIVPLVAVGNRYLAGSERIESDLAALAGAP